MEIQITLSAEELRAAPAAVHEWLVGVVVEGKAGVSKSAATTGDKKLVVEETKQPPAKAEKSTAKAEQPAINERELLEKAAQLIQIEGEDVLAAILKQLGLKRVKGATGEKQAALLALVEKALEESGKD